MASAGHQAPTAFPWRSYAPLQPVLREYRLWARASYSEGDKVVEGFNAGLLEILMGMSRRGCRDCPIASLDMHQSNFSDNRFDALGRALGPLGLLGALPTL